MISTDLKLLVDVAWENRYGQVTYLLKDGEFKAAERLTKQGFLMRDGKFSVGLTDAGERIVGELCSRIERKPWRL